MTLDRRHFIVGAGLATLAWTPRTYAQPIESARELCGYAAGSTVVALTPENWTGAPR